MPSQTSAPPREPVEEPVAWYGPVVMNTREQLVQAVQGLQDGTSIKQR